MPSPPPSVSPAIPTAGQEPAGIASASVASRSSISPRRAPAPTRRDPVRLGHRAHRAEVDHESPGRRASGEAVPPATGGDFQIEAACHRKRRGDVRRCPAAHDCYRPDVLVLRPRGSSHGLVLGRFGADHVALDARVERCKLRSHSHLAHAGSCSGRPKRGKSSGERKAVISSMPAARRVSTMIVSGAKAPACSSHRYPATAG